MSSVVEEDGCMITMEGMQGGTLVKKKRQGSGRIQSKRRALTETEKR